MINIVENTISRFGLRTLHAISFNGPVDVQELREKVPFEGREYAGFYPVWEEELKLYHMFAVWEAREMVDLSKLDPALPLRYGVLWFIKKGESLSVSLELAIEMYKKSTGRMPSAAWMQKLPKGAPKVYETKLGDSPPGASGTVCFASLAMTEVKWNFERFVCVGIPKVEWDPVWKDGKYVEQELTLALELEEI